MLTETIPSIRCAESTHSGRTCDAHCQQFLNFTRTGMLLSLSSSSCSRSRRHVATAQPQLRRSQIEIVTLLDKTAWPTPRRVTCSQVLSEPHAHARDSIPDGGRSSSRPHAKMVPDREIADTGMVSSETCQFTSVLPHQRCGPGNRRAWPCRMISRTTDSQCRYYSGSGTTFRITFPTARVRARLQPLAISTQVLRREFLANCAKTQRELRFSFASLYLCASSSALCFRVKSLTAALAHESRKRNSRKVRARFETEICASSSRTY